jgi:hypothetical protein
MTEDQRLYLVRVLDSIYANAQIIRNMQKGEPSSDKDQTAAEAWDSFKQAYRQLQNQIDALLRNAK